MRAATRRRLLGRLEPPLRDLWHLGRLQATRVRRRGLVVLATGRDHLDRDVELSTRLGPGVVGVWVCCRDDVAALGTRGWFVVRLDPSSVAEPADRRDEVGAVVSTWRRVCRQVEVVDLDGRSDEDPSG